MPNTKPFQQTEHDAEIIAAVYNLMTKGTVPYLGRSIRKDKQTERSDSPIQIDIELFYALLDALGKRLEALHGEPNKEPVKWNPLRFGNMNYVPDPIEVLKGVAIGGDGKPREIIVKPRKITPTYSIETILGNLRAKVVRYSTKRQKRLKQLDDDGISSSGDRPSCGTPEEFRRSITKIAVDDVVSTANGDLSCWVVDLFYDIAVDYGGEEPKYSVYIEDEAVTGTTDRVYIYEDESLDKTIAYITNLMS